VNSAPAGVTFGVDSARSELRRAEAFFRRALEIDPSLVEARLRRGRVLGVLGRHAEARTELLQTIVVTEDPLLLYYGELFLGSEEEALGNRDAAGAAYERAATLYPLAQSPQLGLSQLARRNGDRSGALKAMERMFSVHSDEAEPDDPWWTYHVAQGRNTEALFIELWRPFLDEGRP
jgi:tetratricopeptide (TPR) repeat protein